MRAADVQNGQRRALVFGATGVIGRALVYELTRQRIPVVAVSRTAPAHDADGSITPWAADCRSLDLSRAPVDLSSTSEVYNCTGRVDLSLTEDDAIAANVLPVTGLLAAVAALPARPRVVHVSGYRTAHESSAAAGAYARSKQAADREFRTVATRHGLPWTVVNPSNVISSTNTAYARGSDQLVNVIDKLWRGLLPVAPASPRTFVPVVRDDLLAQFMVAAGGAPAAAGVSLWPMDFETPPFRELIDTIADALHVRRPFAAVDPGLLRRLPTSVTQLSRAAAEFLSEDRYPSDSTLRFAADHDLRLSSSGADDIAAWARHVVATRASPDEVGSRTVIDLGAVPTFGLRLGDAPTEIVVLPGLPVESVTWRKVLAEYGTNGRAGAVAVDLPGTGRTGGTSRETHAAWLRAVLAENGNPPLLVGHSYGCAVALEALDDCPDVRALVLVSPFFLQAAPGPLLRNRTVVAAALRLSPPGGLSRLLFGTPQHRVAMTSVAEALHRPGTATRTASLVARTGDAQWRSRLRDQLAGAKVPVTIICGEHDPLTAAGRDYTASLAHVTLVTVPGGHHMHVTHPAPLAAQLRKVTTDLVG